jgi:hypothetical protein
MNVVGSTWMSRALLSRRSTKAKRTMEMRRLLASPYLAGYELIKLRVPGKRTRAWLLIRTVSQEPGRGVDTPGLKSGAYVDVRYGSQAMKLSCT